MRHVAQIYKHHGGMHLISHLLKQLQALLLKRHSPRIIALKPCRLAQSHQYKGPSMCVACLLEERQAVSKKRFCPLCAALDIGEEKRDGSAWQGRHRFSPWGRGF